MQTVPLVIRQWTAKDAKLGFVAQIMADKTLITADQRIARFAELGGGSRATFMRKQAEWRKLMGFPEPQGGMIRKA